MTLYGMLIVVAFMGGPTPHADAMPVKTLTMEACKAEAAETNSLIQKEPFDIAGNPILYRSYICMPVQKTDLDRLVDKVR